MQYKFIKLKVYYLLCIDIYIKERKINVKYD